MTISEAGLNLIKESEGLCLTAYKCSAGKWTIGYGSTRDVVPGMKINRAQAEWRLRQDVNEAERDVTRLVKVPLTQGMYDALVSFAFNFGYFKLAKSTLLAKLNEGDRHGAAQEFMRWVHAGGEVLPGLVTRRKAEHDLFLT